MVGHDVGLEPVLHHDVVGDHLVLHYRLFYHLVLLQEADLELFHYPYYCFAVHLQEDLHEGSDVDVRLQQVSLLVPVENDVDAE